MQNIADGVANPDMNVTLSLCESESENMSENGNENTDADADKEWNADVSMNVSLSENEGVNMSVNGNEDEDKDKDANKNMERNANVNMNVTLSLCENENSFFFRDGIERPINRPKYPDGQKTCYSGRKKQHTLKNNIVSGEDCKVIFLTETCEGKKSDKKVADEAGYILPKGSILYQNYEPSLIQAAICSRHSPISYRTSGQRSMPLSHSTESNSLFSLTLTK